MPLGLAVTGLAVAGILATLPGIGRRPRATGADHPRAARTGRARDRGGITARTIGALDAPVQDLAAARVGDDGAMLAGGLTAADVSRPDVLLLRGRQVVGHGRLPSALHDAAAATLDRNVYLLGGGDLTQSDQILRIDPATARASSVGRLPEGLSDVAAASLGRAIYVVGGYTGGRAVDTVLAWRPGRKVEPVGRLPSPLRYAAVAALGHELVIVGGSTPTGASRAVLGFDPARHTVRRVGSLPRPVTHAAAAPLGSAVYVLGGRGEVPGTPTDRIWRVELSGSQSPVPGPHKGGSGVLVALAGRLPRPLSDLAAIALPGRILLAGGRRRPAATIGQVAPRP